MEKHKCYYVYVFTDPRKNGNFVYGEYVFLYEPFYVGKGKGNRYKRHTNKTQLNMGQNYMKEGKLKHLIQLGYNPLNYVIIIKNNLTNKQAIKLEEKIIKIIGKIINKSGPLCNIKDRDDDIKILSNNNKGKTYEEIYGEEKAKILKLERSNFFSGKNNPRYGKPSIWRGKKLSKRIREKISKSRRKTIYQYDLEGNFMKEWQSVQLAAKSLGVSKSLLHNCLGKTMISSKTAAGYIWRYYKVDKLETLDKNQGNYYDHD